MNLKEARAHLASQLLAAQSRVGQFKAFIGLDGIVDEIVHVVDKRDGAASWHCPKLRRWVVCGWLIAS